MSEDNKMMAHNAVERVCKQLGDVSTAQIWSKERTFKVATARQLVYWYLWQVCELGYNEIGRAMGKNHATIMYGVQQIEIMLERNRTKEDKRIVKAAQALMRKSDAELVEMYFEDVEPLARIEIARQIKDEDLRMRLLNEAQRQRHLEDEA